MNHLMQSVSLLPADGRGSRVEGFCNYMPGKIDAAFKRETWQKLSKENQSDFRKFYISPVNPAWLEMEKQNPIRAPSEIWGCTWNYRLWVNKQHHITSWEPRRWRRRVTMVTRAEPSWTRISNTRAKSTASSFSVTDANAALCLHLN